MISTHILDISKGTPAQNVKVTLHMQESDSWKEINSGTTNSDGRYSFECEQKSGVYQIVFAIENYFSSESFFVNTPVVFKIENTARKYHVPLLLSPFGYSTYRGS